MLLVAAAIAAWAPHVPPRSPVTPAVQATATVRILSAVRVRLGESRGRDGFVVRESVLRTAGSSQSAKLIEFE